jgi:hypothetical protein
MQISSAKKRASSSVCDGISLLLFNEVKTFSFAFRLQFLNQLIKIICRILQNHLQNPQNLGSFYKQSGFKIF